MQRHFVKKFDKSNLQVPAAYAGHSQGYTTVALADYTDGPVHTGRNVCQLAPGGYIDLHIHSYEESFIIMEGQVLLSLDGHNYLLVPGDYGVIQVGTSHGFRNISNEPVVWQDMLSPQPKPADANPPDTFFVSPGEVPATAERADLRDPRTRFLGHFDDTHLPPAGKMQMEGDTGGNIHGIRLKMLVDHQLGSQHMTLFMVEFTPGGEGVLHDHPFEETYYILSGQAEARLDGKVYPVGPGDFVWTGVGGTHGFFQVGTEPVRWIETQAPQPPAQQGFRFTGEWQYLNEKLHSHGHDHDHDHGHGHSH